MPRRIAFAGCGPLPLSALLLARTTGAVVDGFDRDGRAVALARRVAAAVGARPGTVTVHQQEVAACASLAGYELVVLGGLVGETAAAKARIVAHLGDRMAPGALLLARSAHAMRAMLYPPVHLDGLDPFELCAVVHPAGEVINSVVIARLPAGRG